MNLRDVKKGAVLSYILIIVNTFYGLFFTPYLISTLGDGEYGVYKIIGSLIGSLTVLDLGIGSTVLRYTAKFFAEKKSKELDNFAAMGMIEATIISCLLIIACTIAYFRIGTIYSATLSAAELDKAKSLFILFAVILILNTYEKVIFSLIAGCGHYTVANSLKLARIVLKLVLSILILRRFADSRVLLFVEIGLLIVIMVFQLLYIRRRLSIRIHLYQWDKSLFLGTFKYTMLMFIQSIAVQFNGNLDNMVIGASIGATAVAVYSVGLQLYNMYEQFAVAFSDLMLPSVSKQIAEGASTRELENTVIMTGRLEFIALGGALCGFAVIGREFIQLWLGDGYSFAWTVGMILMIPTTVPLIQNVCLSVLRAQNKMLFRTVAVSVMAVFNLVFTVIGVPKFGAIAACIGTAVGLIGTNIIAMNIYYIKIIKLNIIRIFSEVLKKTWICCLLAGVILFVADRFLSGSWLMWLIKVAVFVIAYGLLLFFYGLNPTEKSFFTKTLKKLFRRV